MLEIYQQSFIFNFQLSINIWYKDNQSYDCCCDSTYQYSACCNVYCGTQVAIQEQIEADEAKIALGVLGGFAVLVGALALAVSGS
jgi:hypothetical protein